VEAAFLPLAFLTDLQVSLLPLTEHLLLDFWKAFPFCNLPFLLVTHLAREMEALTFFPFLFLQLADKIDFLESYLIAEHDLAKLDGPLAAAFLVLGFPSSNDSTWSERTQIKHKTKVVRAKIFIFIIKR